MARLLARVALLLVLVFCSALSAHAYDEVKLREAERLAVLLQAQLKGVVSRIDSGTLQDEALAAQRATLERLRSASTVGAENASGPLGEIAKQVEGLGPAPKDGVQEADVISTQRKDLNAQLARATAAQKQFVLVGLEAEQAMARLTALQRSQFLQRIFKADRSILSPTLWANTWEGSALLLSRVRNMALRGLSDAEGRSNFTGFLLFPIGVAIFWAFALKLLPDFFQRFLIGRASEEREVPSGLEKLWHAIWRFAKYCLSLAVLYMLVNLSLDATGFQTPALSNLFGNFVRAISPALIFGGLVYVVASPWKEKWRLLAIGNVAAKTLILLVVSGYLVYGFGDQVSAFATSLNLPVSFSVGQTAFSALLLIVLISLGLIVVRREAVKGLAGDGNTYFLTWFINFMPLWWALLCLAGLALLFGFIALSYFIAGNLLDTAMLAMTIGIVHAFIDALAAAALNPQSRTGHVLRRTTQWSDQGVQRLVLVIRTIADASLVIAAILTIIALWTVVLFDVAGYLSSWGQGIRLGNITLSPKAIAIGVGVLVFGATATRYVSRWLDSRVLAQTQLDKGVQDSLRTVVGYTGYSLAGLFALSAAGLDFSSLTLVLGALGVGIGLGLQSIVNNFVSGLIMLAERPVRVGDWVVTAGGEGIVKKINVRSTEIETFDNCAIIVPNSNIISQAVLNWTHRDSTGRFGVAVAFNQLIDVDQVVKTLLDIAQGHPKVMRHPPAQVQLVKITPVGFEFDIKGHVRDIFDGGHVASDIRLEIARRIPRESFSSTLAAPLVSESGKVQKPIRKQKA